MPARQGKLLYVVRLLVNSKVEKEWDEWHSKVHIPQVLKEPGFLKATKFRRVDGISEGAEYWTVYEMRDVKAYEKYSTSEAAKKLRLDHNTRYGSSTRLERFVLLRTFEISKTHRRS